MERPEEAPSRPETAANPDLLRVAEEVRQLLAAAEEAAAGIRREAEDEAKAVTDARSRLRSIVFELGRLSGHADGLSYQAEALRRQCDEIRDRLAGEIEADDAGPPARPSKTREEPAEAAPGGEGVHRVPGRDPFARSRARIEAHRMRLAGARRGEVLEYLQRWGAAEAEALVRELFEGRGPGGSGRE